MKAKMKSPVKYYGGKAKMLPHILPLIPDHKVYVEAFAGGASLYFYKNTSSVEMLNDTNRNVTNFYRALKTKLYFDQLMEMIEGTLHCEETHKLANKIYHHPETYSIVERAWAFWVTCNMSFSGEAGGSFQYAWNKKDTWHTAVTIKNKRNLFKRYINRLSETTIFSQKAEELIQKVDKPEVFVYSDPPYIGARQGHYSGYTEDDYEALLKAKAKMKGKFLLSSYDDEVREHYAQKYGWNTQKITQRLGVTGMQKEKVEVLTWNYDLTRNTLFS